MKTKKKILSLILLCFVCVSAFMISFINNKTNTYKPIKNTQIESENIALAKGDSCSSLGESDCNKTKGCTWSYVGFMDQTKCTGTVKIRKNNATFECDKGTCPRDTSCQTTNTDNKCKIPLTGKTATRDDYEFDGWSTDKKCSGTHYFSSKEISKDTTFYACWRKKHTIKFDCDGGINCPSTTYCKTNNDEEDGECKAILVAKPTKKNYRFNGWALSKDCSGKHYYESKTISKGTTFYACWIYEPSEQSSRVSQQSGCYSCEYDGDTYFEYYKQGTAIPDYHNCSTNPVSNYTYNSTYKSCIRNKVTVTIKNLSTSKGKLSYTGDKSCTISNTSTSCVIVFPTATPYSGYVFNGWYTSADCKGTRASNQSGAKFSFTPGSDGKTYYACWSESGSSTTPPTPTYNTQPVEQTPTSTETDYNKDFYIKNGGKLVTGSQNFGCGDKVHVSTCIENESSITCNVTRINSVEPQVTTTVKLEDLVNSFNEANCSSKIKRYIRSSTPDAKYYSNSTLSEGETKVACGATIEFEGEIDEACSFGQNKVCKAKYDGEEIFIPREYLTTNEQTTCSNNQKTTESDTCEAINKLTDQAGNNIKVKECYKKVNGELVYQYEGEQSDLLKCKEGYNKILVPTSDNGCENVSEGKVCYKTLTYNCSKVSKPRVEASGSIINAQGMGTINIKGISESGRKLVGYYISTDKTASISSDWKQFTEQSTDNSARIIATATETKGLNTYFVWVKDDNDALSRAVMVKIYDADLTTTLKDIEIKSSDGSKTYKPTSIKDDTEIAYNNTMKKDAKYVRLSNSLTENTDIAGFEPLSTAYELTVDSPSIALYATLTSDDASYVEGYEPRTVNLEYGENTVLIKIRNNQGKERTYTFIVTREDNRENNNLLSDITLSTGKIEFDSYNSDYTITVPKNLKSVSINGTLSSTKASFVEGYAPRTVKLENEVTSAVIKTISESGSVRSYVFTFEKRGAKEDVTTKNSVYLSSLSIPGTELTFSKETTSYQVSVEHEVDLLRVYALPESENATVEISNTNGLKVGPNLVQITVKNNSKKKIYTIYVNRKEEGLNVSGNTNLGSLTIKDYKIDFNKDILDYTLKIKREKTLMIAATAESKKSEVYMYGNNDLTGFSTVRVKVIAENGDTKVYSIDIQKDSYNKVLELTAGIVGGVIIIGAAIIIVISKKKKKMKEYIEG